LNQSKAIPDLEIESDRKVLVKMPQFEILFDIFSGVAYIIPSIDGNIHWDMSAGESAIERKYNGFTA